MPRLSPLVAAALAVAAVPSAASAGVFKLYGEAQGGGMMGKGLSGDQKDEAFFKKSAGGAYGALVGARFLILDAQIKHTQYFTDELTTWTQFNAGLAFSIDTGGEAAKKAHSGGYLEIGAHVGFGLGTGAQVDPPLDNSEITDKGFMLEGSLSIGKHLSSVFDIGVEVPVSWGYFFKKGAANDESNQYQGAQINAFLVLRANINFI
jgi:hypothetical protein